MYRLYAQVSEGRIEFVDNGWSQHDMGCTTYDSMLNNWVEGHLWLKQRFGAAWACVLTLRGSSVSAVGFCMQKGT